MSRFFVHVTRRINERLRSEIIEEKSYKGNAPDRTARIEPLI